MEKHFEHNSSSVQPQAEPDVVAMLKKIQQQLVFLEKKIDSLINKPSGRPFERKPFLKPQRSFGHSHHYGKGQQGSSSRVGNFGQGRRFDKQQSDGNRKFGQKKKPFYHSRKKHA